MKLKLPLFLSLLFAAFVLQSQEADKTRIGGYVQSRFQTGNLVEPVFSIRRAKVWLNSTSSLKHGNVEFFFKTEFSTEKSVNFKVLDVKTSYNIRNFSLILGQQVPDFSLERVQKDEFLAFPERALPVSNLVPAAETSARDIGLQAKYKIDTTESRFALGIFNGYGAGNFDLTKKSFMLTERFVYAIVRKPFLFTAGQSFSFRQTENLRFNKFYYPDSAFSGIDRRYAVEFHFKKNNTSLQGEYIEAVLNKDIAYGYYFLWEQKIKRTFWGLTYEEFTNVENSKRQVLGFTSSYLFDSHNFKLVFANYFTLGNPAEYRCIIQLQYIFKPLTH